MKRIIAMTGLLLIGVSLTGCSDNDSHHNGDDQDMDAKVSFTDFVKGEIDNTKDDREAVDINEIEFTYNDQTNENAFDDVVK